MEVKNIVMKNVDVVQDYILHDMSEGIIAIGFDSFISFMNPSAGKMLGRQSEDLVGKSFVDAFFDDDLNDEFTQAVCDAIYDREKTHRSLVNYTLASGEVRQINMTTSFLSRDGENVGIVCVMSDVSELEELRDELKTMQKIEKMNAQLEIRNRLLSETFGRFLSDEIVRNLLETPDGLAMGGKKRLLTILMSDLRGFTALSERMNASDLIDMLNHYLGEMTEIIQRNNGTIIEFIGDGIMAVFGAPAPSPVHASEAVSAAVEMQAKMKDINFWNVQKAYPELEMGIGINTGEVIVGNIGSEKRTKYGVVGNQVNIAGRIESYTIGGQILIGPMTRELVPEELTVDSEMSVSPKGVDKPLVLSSVTAIGAPYNVSIGGFSDRLEELPQAAEISYAEIYEKHIDPVPKKGEILSLGSRTAVMKTENEIAEFSNLRIDLGEFGQLFVKVTSKENSGYRIVFTSCPEEFEQWKMLVTKRQSQRENDQ